MNIFEQAARQKVRFETSRGLFTVEELFDLPLTSNTGKVNLDDIAKKLYQELKNEEVSFVKESSQKAALTNLKFELVKSVIETKLAENAAEVSKRKKAEKREQILAVIAAKENEAVNSLPIEELRKMLENLG